MESDDEYNEGENNVEFQADSFGNDDAMRDQVHFKSVVNQVIRIILGKDIKHQVFRRDNLPSELNIRSLGFNNIITEVNRQLNLIYGLNLQEIEPDKKSKTKSKQQFAIVSNLTAEDRSLLGDLWRESLDEIINEKTISDNQYFLPTYKQSSAPGSNSELVKLGIMFLVIGCIIISENNIAEHELLEILKNFGISKNINIRNSNFGSNLQELMNEFIKSEYITKEVIKGNTESENAYTYCLGRRALLELSPQDVYNYIKTIWGKKFDEVEASKTILTIERIYNVKLVNEFDQEESGEDNSVQNANSEANGETDAIGDTET